MGFPGGAVDRNPPTNTEDTGLTLSRKIPHTGEQLSLGTTAAEPVFQSLRAAAREATVRRIRSMEKKSNTCSSQLEKAHS